MQCGIAFGPFTKCFNWRIGFETALNLCFSTFASIFWNFLMKLMNCYTHLHLLVFEMLHNFNYYRAPSSKIKLRGKDDIIQCFNFLLRFVNDLFQCINSTEYSIHLSLIQFHSIDNDDDQLIYYLTNEIKEIDANRNGIWCSLRVQCAVCASKNGQVNAVILNARTMPSNQFGKSY